MIKDFGHIYGAYKLLCHAIHSNLGLGLDLGLHRIRVKVRARVRIKDRVSAMQFIEWVVQFVIVQIHRMYLTGIIHYSLVPRLCPGGGGGGGGGNGVSIMKYDIICHIL